MKKGLFSTEISRRNFLTTAAVGASLGLSTTKSLAGARTQQNYVEEETRSLDEIYEAALAQGGELTIYAGGDTSSQQDGTRSAFLSRFPKMKINIIVDYSKNHDVRVDNQLETDSLVPDLVQLQTLQNFERWKWQDRLLNYKPAGFEYIYPSLRDADGAWNSVIIYPFSFIINQNQVTSSITPEEFINSAWKGKIASSYPHDDDAVLYLYSLYAEAYGCEWIDAFARQEVQFARGSHKARESVNNNEKPIGIGSSGSPVSTGSLGTWVLPTNAPFVAWGQRAAIFKQAKNIEAAKLYMSWQISKESQANSYSGWPVRTDVSPRGGLAHLWDYPNANLEGFPEFMRDRAQIERWKQTFALYFGEVKGDATPGWLGVHPGA